MKFLVSGLLMFALAVPAPLASQQPDDGFLVLPPITNGPATVLVNGNEHGTLASKELTIELSPGSHVVRVEKTGFAPFSQTINIVSRQPEILEVTLVESGVRIIEDTVAAGATEQLVTRVRLIHLEPARVDIEIDGLTIGQTPAEVELPVGEHQVALGRSSFCLVFEPEVAAYIRVRAGVPEEIEGATDCKRNSSDQVVAEPSSRDTGAEDLPDGALRLVAGVFVPTELGFPVEALEVETGFAYDDYRRFWESFWLTEESPGRAEYKYESVRDTTWSRMENKTYKGTLSARTEREVVRTATTMTDVQVLYMCRDGKCSETRETALHSVLDSLQRIIEVRTISTFEFSGKKRELDFYNTYSYLHRSPVPFAASVGRGRRYSGGRGSVFAHDADGNLLFTMDISSDHVRGAVVHFYESGQLTGSVHLTTAGADCLLVSRVNRVQDRDKKGRIKKKDTGWPSPGRSCVTGLLGN